MFPQISLTASEETFDFAEWAINVNPRPVSGHEVRQWAESKLHVKTLPPVVKRSGPRFQVGDMVRVDANKHKDHSTIMPYVSVDSEIGEVKKVEGKDVVVKFESGKTVLLQNANVSMGSGLFRYAEPQAPTSAPRFEMVYTADPSTTSSDDAKVVVELYVQRGAERGDLKRHVSYYSGYAYFGRETQGGGWILAAGPHQRLDPSGRQQIRSFNPDKGLVHYLGLMGHRPSKWKSELDAFRQPSTSERYAFHEPDGPALHLYNAIANQTALRELGGPELERISVELLEKIRQNAEVDWPKREPIKARMRNAIRSVLRRHAYPSSMLDKVAGLVLEQVYKYSVVDTGG